MTKQYPRYLFPIPLLVDNSAFTPGQEQTLIQGDVMMIGIMRSDVIAQHHITERRMSACMHDLDVSERKGQRMILGVLYLDHLIPAVQELSLGRAVP